MLSEVEILERLRKICLPMADVDETTTFCHPTFRVKGKIFLVLEEYKGKLGICVKVEKELQGIFLDDSRFFLTPYIGKHGWVTLKVYAARLNWTEVRELVRGSYRLVSTKAPKSKGTMKPKIKAYRMRRQNEKRLSGEFGEPAIECLQFIIRSFEECYAHSHAILRVDDFPFR